MSSTPASQAPSRGPAPRVRDQAREAVVLMLFSAAASLAGALGLVVLTRLGR